MNPPYPYDVIIKRAIENQSPFAEGDGYKIIYNGKCDYESPYVHYTHKGVQVDKYNMYIKNNRVPVRKRDLIELTLLNGEIVNGVITDYVPTNLGLTIVWEVVNN